MLAIASPAALLFASWWALWKTGLGVLHGDFLHSVKYSVPIRMVRSTGLSDPTIQFLPLTAEGNRAEHLEDGAVTYFLTHVVALRFLKNTQRIITVGIVVGFSAPNLMSKTMMIAQSGIYDIHHSEPLHIPIYQSINLSLPVLNLSVGIAIAMGAACLGSCPYAVYMQRKVMPYLWMMVRHCLGLLASTWKDRSEDPTATKRCTEIAFKLIPLIGEIFARVYFLGKGAWASWVLLQPFRSNGNQEITPTLATQWGDAGFWLVAMLVSVYYCADVPWMCLSHAVEVKKAAAEKHLDRTPGQRRLLWWLSHFALAVRFMAMTIVCLYGAVRGLHLLIGISYFEDKLSNVVGHSFGMLLASYGVVMNFTAPFLPVVHTKHVDDEEFEMNIERHMISPDMIKFLNDSFKILGEIKDDQGFRTKTPENSQSLSSQSQSVSPKALRAPLLG